jgi:hypothetical protein
MSDHPHVILIYRRRGRIPPVTLAAPAKIESNDPVSGGRTSTGGEPIHLALEIKHHGTVVGVLQKLGDNG